MRSKNADIQQFRQFLLRHWLVTCLSVFLALNYAWELIKEPRLNPTPTDYITIYGKFPFHDKASLHFAVFARTTNPACTIGAFDVPGGTRASTSKSYPASHLLDGSYAIKLPKDTFSHGFCGWTFSGIGFAVMDSAQSNYPSYSAVSLKSSKQMGRCFSADLPTFDANNEVVKQANLICSVRDVTDVAFKLMPIAEFNIDYGE